MRENERRSSQSLRRIPALDGARGAAILLVLLYHYVAVPIPEAAGGGWHIVRQMLSKGWSGVDLFFVLSGFLITRILLHHREAENYFRVFYLRRVARIFPLYYFVLLLFWSLRWVAQQGNLLPAALFASAMPLWPYFLYLQNFSMVLHGTFGNEFLAVTWSLAVEEQFYLFLPFLVRKSERRKFPVLAGFLVIFPLMLRYTLGSGHFYDFVLMPWRMDALFFGALLAIVEAAPGGLALAQRYGGVLKAVLGVLVAFFVYTSFAEPLGTLKHFFLLGLMYALLILLLISDDSAWLAHLFKAPFLRFLGGISYGIYLFHQMVNGILHALVLHRSPRLVDAHSAAVTVLAGLVTCLLALATYHGFEKRLIAWGHRFRYRG